jgi:hypothetical protein
MLTSPRFRLLPVVSVRAESRPPATPVVAVFLRRARQKGLTGVNGASRIRTES